MSARRARGCSDRTISTRRCTVPERPPADTQARRIYQDFGTIEDESTVGYSQYHSLQLTANKRFSRGFTLLAAYTFSKDIGLTSSQGEGSLGTRDPNNWNLDKGLMPTDRPTHSCHLFGLDGAFAERQ